MGIPGQKVIARPIGPRGRAWRRIAALLLGSVVGWLAAGWHGPLYDVSLTIPGRDAGMRIDELTAYLERPSQLDSVVQELHLDMTVQQLAARMRKTTTDESVSLFLRTWDRALGHDVMERFSATIMEHLVSVARAKEHALNERSRTYLQSLSALPQEAPRSRLRWAKRRIAAVLADPLYGSPMECLVQLKETRNALSQVTNLLQRLSTVPPPTIQSRRLSPWQPGLQRSLAALMLGLVSVIAVSWGLSSPTDPLRDG